MILPSQYSKLEVRKVMVMDESHQQYYVIFNPYSFLYLFNDGKFTLTIISLNKSAYVFTLYNDVLPNDVPPINTSSNVSIAKLV